MCWYTHIYRIHVLNKLQTYCDGRFKEGGAFLYTLRPDRRPMANEPH